MWQQSIKHSKSRSEWRPEPLRTTKISLSIDKKILEIIDKRRGLIPRSAYIMDLVEKGLRAQGLLGEPSLRSAH